MIDQVTLKKGLVVHLNGFPFQLKEDTPANGLEKNYELAIHPYGTDRELNIFTLQQTLEGWYVGHHDNQGNRMPGSEYPNEKLAIARIIQLLGIKEPVEPQKHPERFCIGFIKSTSQD